MTYTIRLIHGMSQYTAYEGKSVKSARNATEIIRAVLIMTGGTATICVSYNGGGNVPMWQVQDGAAVARERLETSWAPMLEVK